MKPYKKQVLRIQDYMILEIISDLFLKHPIYFAATVAETNQVGLDKYLEMEGMVYKVIPNKIDKDIRVKINYDNMKLNLTQASLRDTIKTSDDYINSIENKMSESKKEIEKLKKEAVKAKRSNKVVDKNKTLKQI